MTEILQLAKFYPPVEGGMESIVFEITEGLSAKGLDVSVLCANDCNKSTIEQRGNYQVVRAASLGRIFSTSLSPELIHSMRREFATARVVHVHMPNPLAALALLLSDRPKRKIVVHWHSDIIAQKITLKLYRPIQNWLLRRAEVIVATSPPYAAKSKELGDYLSKVVVVPLGIRDPSPPRQCDVAAIRSRYLNKRIIFALGRHVYYKGFEHLIKAASYLPDDVGVVIGGKGPLSDSLQGQVTALGLADKVFLVGRIPEKQVSAYFSAADIFCLPSTHRSEAFGVVLLEAMAASKPVVATRITGSGVPWVNGHLVTGLNADPASPESLAGAFMSLLDKPVEAKKMGERGRQRYLENFTAKTMIDRICGVYDLLA